MAQESGAGIWDEVYIHACIQSVIFQQMSTKSLDLKSLWFCDPGGCSYKKDDEAGPVVSRRKAKR